MSKSKESSPSSPSSPSSEKSLPSIEERFVEGEIKVNTIGDVTGKTLIFSIPVGTPDEYLEMFRDFMIESFPEAKEILVVKGDIIRQIDIIG